MILTVIAEIRDPLTTWDPDSSLIQSTMSTYTFFPFVEHTFHTLGHGLTAALLGT